MMQSNWAECKFLDDKLLFIVLNKIFIKQKCKCILNYFWGTIDSLMEMR